MCQVIQNFDNSKKNFWYGKNRFYFLGVFSQYMYTTKLDEKLARPISLIFYIYHVPLESHRWRQNRISRFTPRPDLPRSPLNSGWNLRIGAWNMIFTCIAPMTSQRNKLIREFEGASLLLFVTFRLIFVCCFYQKSGCSCRKLDESEELQSYLEVLQFSELT